MIDDARNHEREVNFFPENRAVCCEIVWKKYGGGRHSTNDIIRRKNDNICMPDNWGKNTDTHDTYFLFLFFIITNKHTIISYQYISQQSLCAVYTATCSDTFLSPSDSLEPLPC
jgi:hypothetical protein